MDRGRGGGWNELLWALYKWVGGAREGGWNELLWGLYGGIGGWVGGWVGGTYLSKEAHKGGEFIGDSEWVVGVESSEVPLSQDLFE